MQLFLSAWFVIADLCSITADTPFCSLVYRLIVMFSSPFISFHLLLMFFESCSKCYRSFADIRVATDLTRDFVYTVCIFTIFHFWIHF